MFKAFERKASIGLALCFGVAVSVSCGTGWLNEGTDGDSPPADSGSGGPCGEIVCPTNTECWSGRCVPVDLCRDVLCSNAGEVCSEGVCVSGGLDADGDGFTANDDCDDNDPAIGPGSTLPCYTACGEGVVTCRAGALWADCTAPDTCDCVAGDTLETDCGRCGQSTRQCVDGTWGAAGPCAGEGECSPGAAEVQDCGSCRREERTCSGDCRWGGWGVCTMTGECEPGASPTSCTTSCGSTGTRSCSADCFYTACQPGPENDIGSCSDSMDNDCDGQIDCNDSGCFGLGDESCVGGRCSDGVDNDCDGQVDCNDLACDGCVPDCGSAEDNNLTCHDGVDNDGDGAVDCNDSGCNGVGEFEMCSGGLCGDGIDNDCRDGTDCADFGCDGCCPWCPGTENDDWTCHDWEDNDCDGNTDCADSSCYGVGEYETCAAGLCSDGVDNDCMDGMDCSDWGCADCC